MPIETIKVELCNGCGICIDSCMMDVIRMNEDNRVAFIKYQKDCMACRSCELDCPTQAIYVTPAKGTPAILPWG